MLDTQSELFRHWAKNLSLLLVSIAVLPFSTLVLLASYATRPFSRHNAFRRQQRGSGHFRPKTVVVTGVGMSKGMRIARAFYETGHNVVGVDFEAQGIPDPGRFSKALDKFYSISEPSAQHGASRYIRDLVYIVEKEEADLWVGCSGSGTAEEDGQIMEMIERRTSCRSIQFDSKTAVTLHEKDTFMSYAKSLGLPSLETHHVASRAAVHSILNDAPVPRRRYILKMVGVDQLSRTRGTTVLPKRTPSQTYGHVSNLPVSKTVPWVLQRFVEGEEYTTHAVVVNGQVKLFAACPSTGLLMHYQLEPPTSGISKAMLNFTQEFAHRAGPSFTGHFSCDLMVEEKITETGVQKSLYPIECNPRAHTAVVLFSGLKGSQDIVKAYLTALEPTMTNGTNSNGSSPLSKKQIVNEDDSIGFPQSSVPYYWISYDLVTLVLLPVLHLLIREISARQFVKGLITFLEHVIFWKDGFFEVWDPLPWWWLHHIYWPSQFLLSLSTGDRWSYINMSTNKAWEN